MTPHRPPRCRSRPARSPSSPPPNDADLLELLYRYVRSDAELMRVLVENPSRLFGYDA